MRLIFSILLLLIAWSPRFWWFWGFVFLSAVQLVMAILYPVVLAPLFNKFEPVRDVELSEKIRTQMEKSGIRVKKILQMNAGLQEPPHKRLFHRNREDQTDRAFRYADRIAHAR